MSVPLTGQQTFERAQALLQSGRSAALPELLTLIETLSTSDATVPEIAEIIEKDAAILGKVLSLANTVAHNPGIAPVKTLSQALHQIGYQRVRSMAVSLLLLDSASGPNTPPEQREAAARSLTAGLLAQGLAETYGTHDPELAFACAALRPFGRILMAAVSPELYREAQDLAKKEPPEENCFRRRFGLTSLDLSRRVLSAARVPAEVLATLRDCEPESLNSTATQHEVRLLGLADLSGRLAALSLDPAGSDGFVKRTRLLARRYERLFPEVSEHLKPAFRCADDRLRSFLRCKGVAALPTLSLSRVRQRLETIDPEVINEGDGTIGSIFAPTTGTGTPTSAIPNPAAIPTASPLVAAAPTEKPPAPSAASAAAPTPVPPPAPAIATAAVAAAPDPTPATTPTPPAAIPATPSTPSVAATPRHQLPDTPSTAPFPTATPAPTVPSLAASDADLKPASLAPFPAPLPLAASASRPPLDPAAARLNDPRQAALALIRDGFGAQECWLFHRPSGGTTFSGACGVGEWWPTAQPRAVVSSGERTMFGVCLTRREPVVIHDAADPTTLAYLPDWLRETIGARGSFVLVPLTEGETLLGLAFIGWHTARKIALSQAQLALARQVLSSIKPLPPATRPASRAA